MYRIKEKIILIAFTCMGSYLSAQNLHSVKDSHHIYNVNKSHTIYDVKDSVKIFFRQGKIDLDPILNDNQSALNRIADTMRTCYADSIYQLRKILVVGAASPEGTLKFNKWLSLKRADVLFSYLSQYSTLPDSLKTSSIFSPDWKGLIQMVKNDSQLPFREETLSLLNRIAGEAETEKEILKQEKHLELIKNLRGGIPYHYMYKKYFPALRFSQLFLWYDKVQKPQIPDSIPKWGKVKQSMDTVSNTDPSISSRVRSENRSTWQCGRTCFSMSYFFQTSDWNSIWAKAGRWRLTGCTDGGRPTGDTGTGEPTAVTSPSENGGEKLLRRNRSLVTTSASIPKFSPTISKQAVVATWVANLAVLSGIR